MTAIVIIQALAGLFLTAIPLLPGFIQKPEGCLSRSGRRSFGLAAFIFIAATASAQILNQIAADRAQERNEQLINKLFISLAPQVMATPKGPQLAPPVSSGQDVEITSPADGALVNQRQLVRGRAVNAREVWVLVHPLETSSYWVQPRVTLGSNSEWIVTGYFGRSGSLDSGKSFEVVAVIDPEQPLQEGAILDRWPQGRGVSNSITVRRQ